MTESHRRLESLWKRIEDARLQCYLAHQATRKLNREHCGIPSPDGDLALTQAVSVEVLAVKEHLRALEEYYAALEPMDQRPAIEKAVGSNTHPEDVITPREREVLRLIASGKTSKQIAQDLGIAFRTAVCHRYRLYQKLKVHSNVELMRAALRMGLVEL